MRDDFTEATKRVLAKRVAYMCSNPGCRRVTVGPASHAHGTVSIGVAAHITAASPGGPRYDDAMTSIERVAADNGIWLCETCGKHVDVDVPGHSVDVLRRWKMEAEEFAGRALGSPAGAPAAPIGLYLPEASSEGFLLSYTNTAIKAVGREHELSALGAFLDDEASFSWWLWTGPAGVGKSRLALELCIARAADWHAGFLGVAEQSRLSTIAPSVPTLVIVDYAAQRAEWLSDSLLALSRRPGDAKVRVLVLERDAAGPWWDAVQRHHSLSEGAIVAASMYGLPETLSGLSRGRVRPLVRAAATQLGAPLSDTQLEYIVDHTYEIDPLGRPLFALVACLDWLGDAASRSRDEALRRLISRADALLDAAFPNAAAVLRAKNVRALATTLGGLSLESYEALLAAGEDAALSGLVPHVFDDIGPVDLGELLGGLSPDILGELSLLDRLTDVKLPGHAARAVRDLAWRWSPTAYGAFVARAAADHREHPSLHALLDVESEGATETWAEVLVSVIPLLGRPDHPVISSVLTRLQAARDAEPDAELDRSVAIAFFHVANLMLQVGNIEGANTIYSAVIDESEESWEVHAHARNNRGATWLMSDRSDLANEDFTAIIESPAAVDEVRAMSYNNRADVFDEADDPAAAIADRTSVLELAETSYNRRFIALVRRAAALRLIGDFPGADADIQTLLNTADIAVEQKMAARLERAQWRIEDGDLDSAVLDLDAVVASRRNFESVCVEAARLMAVLSTRRRD